MEPKEFVSTKIAAKEFSVDIRTIQRWARESKMKAYRFGTHYYFLRKELEEFKARKFIAVKL